MQVLKMSQQCRSSLFVLIYSAIRVFPLVCIKIEWKDFFNRFYLYLLEVCSRDSTRSCKNEIFGDTSHTKFP